MNQNNFQTDRGFRMIYSSQRRSNVDMTRVKCHRCQAFGHFARNCPDNRQYKVVCESKPPFPIRNDDTQTNAVSVSVPIKNPNDSKTSYIADYLRNSKACQTEPVEFK